MLPLRVRRTYLTGYGNHVFRRRKIICGAKNGCSHVTSVTGVCRVADAIWWLLICMPAVLQSADEVRGQSNAAAVRLARAIASRSYHPAAQCW